MSEFLTTDEAAEALGLSPRTLRNWRTRGGGPVATKLGAAVRYRRRDLEAFASARRQDRTPMPSAPSPRRSAPAGSAAGRGLSSAATSSAGRGGGAPTGVDTATATGRGNHSRKAS